MMLGLFLLIQIHMNDERFLFETLVNNVMMYVNTGISGVLIIIRAFSFPFFNYGIKYMNILASTCPQQFCVHFFFGSLHVRVSSSLWRVVCLYQCFKVWEFGATERERERDCYDSCRGCNSHVGSVASPWQTSNSSLQSNFLWRFCVWCSRCNPPLARVP